VSNKSKPTDIGGEWERRFAKRIGGKLQPGSGNQWFAKLDVGSRSFLWSLKATSFQSFRLTKDVIYEAARAVIGPGGKGGDTIPGIALDIDGEEVVVLRLSDFLHIVSEEVKIVEPNKAEQKRALAKLPKFQRRVDEEEVEQ
jgi:hypothetical protein